MPPSSTKLDPHEPVPFWRTAGHRYYRLGLYFRQVFGQPTWKITVDAGFDCPNRDGTVGTGGCRFCNPASFSPNRRHPLGGIADQIAHGAARLGHRHGTQRFLAYFQPGTNTYAPVSELRARYEEALACPGVVGLIVGTRPDCIADDALDLLADLARSTWVSLELGIQTIHDRSLDWLQRGHLHEASVDAVTRAKQRGLAVGAHLILGLPDETRGDMLATADEMTRLKIESVKLHNLYVVGDTPLARDHAAGRLALPSREQYIDCVVGFLERLRPECVVHRLAGDAPPEYLIEPQWCGRKTELRAAIEAELERRDTFQGRFAE
ncbi:MAG TPA: TIGR01212 family radical SAM protein [Planctomycetaceae bacterium]|nr:TIGR01212 family radical SAM protein [Planctomycetaceae bacterium]